MFTGLVEALGTVAARTTEGPGDRLEVICPDIAPELVPGESVAVNGACLTVVARDEKSFHFQVGPESLRRTNLGELVPGDWVNLERSLRLSDRLGGHFVQGHIDGVGSIDQRLPQGEWVMVWFRCPQALAAQMVPKGSVAVDGISLTLVDVEAERFSVALIPHTLAHTTLGLKQPGAAVNLETDLLAKYVWKALQLK